MVFFRIMQRLLAIRWQKDSNSMKSPPSDWSEIAPIVLNGYRDLSISTIR
jgi:hypothetical protein